MNKKKFLVEIAIFISLIFLINYTAMKFHWYSLIWWFDMLMHFLGGFWVGIFVLWFLNPKQMDLKTILIVIFMVFLIGFLWEIFEYFLNILTTKNVFDKKDTLSDLFFDISGGFFALIYFFGRFLKNSL